MPTRSEYAALTLSDALRHLADHHYEERTRHLSHDEYQLLQRAADALQNLAPTMPAFA
jgi:hypothetical protein